MWVLYIDQPLFKTNLCLCLFSAIVAEVINPDELALAALSEEFGVYKFVDFATGKEGREGRREKRNDASSITSNVVLVASVIALQQLWAGN